LLIEIKRDLKSDETGNFAFEYWSWGKPSGLATTLADIWVMVDTKAYYLCTTERLKEFLRANWQLLHKVNAGDSKASKCVLVRKCDIVTYVSPRIISRTPEYWEVADHLLLFARGRTVTL
jgi:hypothetical protein